MPWRRGKIQSAVTEEVIGHSGSQGAGRLISEEAACVLALRLGEQQSRGGSAYGTPSEVLSTWQVPSCSL